MLNPITSTLLVAAVVMAIVGCGSPSPVSFAPQSRDDMGRVQATINGAVESSFEGTGFFSNDPDFRLGLPAKFQFSSEGRASSEGEMIFGAWFEGGVPEVGTYQFSIPNWNHHRGLWMFYEVKTAEGRENYAVSAGTLEVTKSSRDRVEGRFQAEAWLACSNGVACPELDGTLPRLKQIRLTGSFNLVPADPMAATPE